MEQIDDESGDARAKLDRRIDAFGEGIMDEDTEIVLEAQELSSISRHGFVGPHRKS